MKKTISSKVAGFLIITMISMTLGMVPVYAVTPTVIMSTDSFGSADNNDVPGWVDGGGDNSNDSYTSNNSSRSGSATAHHARVRDGGTITKTISTVGYQTIVLKYYWRGDDEGDGDSDNLKVQWKKTSDSTFSTLNTHKLDKNENWSSQVSVSLPPSANNTSIDIRFLGDSNDNDEEGRVDDVSLEGTATVVNRAPVAQATSIVTDEDMATSSAVLATDDDGDKLLYSIVDNPTHGTVPAFDAETGVFTYTPADNYNGLDSFTFKAYDGTVDSSTALVSITVNSVNDNPVLSALSIAPADELTLITFTASASDVDGDIPTYTLSGAPTGASIDSGTGVFSWTPTEEQGPNSYTFDVVASDGKGGSDSKSVTLTIKEVATVPPCDENVTQTVVSTEGDNIEGVEDSVTPSVLAWVHPTWASVDSASWIWHEAEVTDGTSDHTNVFTKTFTVTGVITSADLEIAADNGYKVEVNGNVVTDKFDVEANYTPTAHYDIASQLTSGVNTVKITVKNFAMDPSTFETNPAGVVYKITITKNECEVPPVPTPVSTVTMCKLDSKENSLAGWTVMLKGESVQAGLVVPTNVSSGVDSTALLAGTSYIATASGLWTNQGGANPVDAEYSTTDGWATHMDGYTGYQTDILELQINNAFDPASNWGAYNTAHMYAQSFVPALAGPANFRVFDGSGVVQDESWFGDNAGTLNVDINKGYAGVTGENGCMTFIGIPYGTYTTGEIMQDGWVNVSGLGEVVVDSATENFTIVNRTTETPNEVIGGGGGGGMTEFGRVGCKDPIASNYDAGAVYSNVFLCTYAPQVPTPPVGQVLGASSTTVPQTPPAGMVLGAETSCKESGLYFTKYAREGYKNDVETVKKLQTYLNAQLGLQIPVTGVFGPMTTAGLKKLQLMHKDTMLAPWGITEPTGILYLTTVAAINKMICSDLSTQVDAKDLIPFSKHPSTPKR